MTVKNALLLTTAILVAAIPALVLKSVDSMRGRGGSIYLFYVAVIGVGVLIICIIGGIIARGVKDRGGFAAFGRGLLGGCLGFLGGSLVALVIGQARDPDVIVPLNGICAVLGAVAAIYWSITGTRPFAGFWKASGTAVKSMGSRAMNSKVFWATAVVIGICIGVVWQRDKIRVLYFVEPGEDLRHANLRSMDLEGANLERADLRYANLGGTNLRNSNLKRARLQKANLEGTNLEGANLERAGLWDSDLSKLNLLGANLTSAGLWGANLAGANLAWANLTDANLTDADLEHTHMMHSNLNGANLAGANLWRTNLARANLRDAKLISANLAGANLSGANLEHAKLVSANLKGAKIIGANLQNADIQEANLKGADLQDSNLGVVCMYGANMMGANLILLT